MNTQTHEALKMAINQLKDVHAQQGNAGNWDYDDYMRGLYNGLELALSLFESREPVYKEALAEAALNEMQKNAEELGLTYCKHGSDDACKECYMEQAEKQEPTWIVNDTAGTKLRKYTNPAPSWQSLSDDEIDEIIEKHDGVFGAVVRAIEQALKEKNHPCK